MKNKNDKFFYLKYHLGEYRWIYVLLGALFFISIMKGDYQAAIEFSSATLVFTKFFCFGIPLCIIVSFLFKKNHDKKKWVSRVLYIITDWFSTGILTCLGVSVAGFFYLLVDSIVTWPLAVGTLPGKIFDSILSVFCIYCAGAIFLQFSEWAKKIDDHLHNNNRS